MLGVLPVIVLTETGIIVGIGVLLVWTVLVPALVPVLGGRFWWPRRLPRYPDPAAPVVDEPPAAAARPGLNPAALENQHQMADSPLIRAGEGIWR